MKNKLRLLIREAIKNISLKEDYPSGFDFNTLNSITSFKQRVDYCDSNLQKLKQGSARIVYSVDDEKVLKLAWNKKGIAQNESEIDFSKEVNLEGVLARITNYAEDFSWIEMELALKPKKSDFKRVIGFSFEDYSAALFNHAIDAGSIKNGMHKMNKEPISSEVVENMWEEEFMQDMFDIIGTYGIPVGDLLRISSYGIVKRDGKEFMVLVDYGLTEDVLNDFYR